MDHMHEPEASPLDIDRAGYYFPQLQELFIDMEYEELNKQTGAWASKIVDGTEYFRDIWSSTTMRVRYLQAKDIVELGFGRIAQSIPMYQRGSYTITAYRLLDPTYSKLKISQHGVTIFEGHVKNKSELRRILIFNEINFAGN